MSRTVVDIQVVKEQARELAELQDDLLSRKDKYCRDGISTGEVQSELQQSLVNLRNMRRRMADLVGATSAFLQEFAERSKAADAAASTAVETGESATVSGSGGATYQKAGKSKNIGLGEKRYLKDRQAFHVQQTKRAKYMEKYR